VQLIDHGIPQGVIGEGPHGFLMICINLTFIGRKKNAKGETFLQFMDNHHL
jgi:hypothetical protein